MVWRVDRLGFVALDVGAQLGPAGDGVLVDPFRPVPHPGEAPQRAEVVERVGRTGRLGAKTSAPYTATAGTVGEQPAGADHTVGGGASQRPAEPPLVAARGWAGRVAAARLAPWPRWHRERSLEAHDRRGRALLALSVAMVAWGVTGVIAKSVDMGGMALAAYRTTVGAVVLITALLVTGRRITWADVRAAAPGGVFLGLDLVFFFSAVKLTTVANATVIGALAARARHPHLRSPAEGEGRQGRRRPGPSSVSGERSW